MGEKPRVSGCRATGSEPKASATKRGGQWPPRFLSFKEGVLEREHPLNAGAGIGDNRVGYLNQAFLGPGGEEFEELLGRGAVHIATDNGAQGVDSLAGEVARQALDKVLLGANEEGLAFIAAPDGIDDSAGRAGLIGQ